MIQKDYSLYDKYRTYLDLKFLIRLNKMYLAYLTFNYTEILKHGSYSVYCSNPIMCV